MPNNTPMPVNDKIKGLQAPYNSRKKKYSDNTIKQMVSRKGRKILFFIVGISSTRGCPTKISIAI
jgi:hypothetical protein